MLLVGAAGERLHLQYDSNPLVLLDLHQAFPEVSEMQIFSKVFERCFWTLLCPSW